MRAHSGAGRVKARAAGSSSAAGSWAASSSASQRGSEQATSMYPRGSASGSGRAGSPVRDSWRRRPLAKPATRWPAVRRTALTASSTAA